MRPSGSSHARYVQVSLRHLHLMRRTRRVLRDVTWRIAPGERWVLAGANGAGKTQLLKVVCGAVRPTQSGCDRPRRYRWRNEVYLSPFEVKEQIAYLGPERQDKYERYGWNYTVEQVVGTGLYRTDIPLSSLTTSDRRRIGALLSRLAISDLAARRFLSLSYGERRLTLLARVLAARPKLLLLDELLSGLDASNHARAMRWLRRSGRSHMPWVLAAHRMADVPECATHALILDGGRVVYRGRCRGAPLGQYLHESARRRRTRNAPPRRAERLLLRLNAASVFLDERRILQDLSLEVRSGDCWVIHGPNGSGKTTLLRTLYGDHGVARRGQIERGGWRSGRPLQEFKRRVGFVAPHLQADHPRGLKVSEVVQSGRHASIGLNAPPTRADRSIAERSLASFGLATLASRTLEELSYGQMRRVLFARAWVSRPRLLLLDEPFAGVDAPTRRGLLERIFDLLEGDGAIVIATHHRNEWPRGTTHELELAGGRALYCGPVR